MARGEEKSRNAFITLDVKGLKTTVTVKVNGFKVGKLYAAPNTSDFQKTWFNQTINMFGSKLNNGDNVLELEAKPGDNFRVKNAYCFFHQKS